MGHTTDISPLLHFHFYKEVYYKLSDDKKGGFPSASAEAKGYMVGIAEHLGHVLTHKVLTHNTEKIVYCSELHPTHSGPNKCLNLLSGEDFLGGKKFIKSKSDFKDVNLGDVSDQNKKPVGALWDLVGKTFLMEEQEDG